MFTSGSYKQILLWLPKPITKSKVLWMMCDVSYNILLYCKIIPQWILRTLLILVFDIKDECKGQTSTINNLSGKLQ